MTEHEERLNGITANDVEKMSEKEYTIHTLKVYLRANGYSEQEIKEEIEKV